MKILIIRYEHIGDYGLVIPMILAIKKKFPKAKIDLVVGPWNREFAMATPGINKIIIFDNPLIKKHIKYWEVLRTILLKPKKLREHIRILNQEDYDVMIDFSDRKFSRYLDRLIYAKKKILGTKYHYIGEREPVRMARILHNELGISEIPGKIKMKYSKKDKTLVDVILNCIKGNRIVMHPIAELPEKNWEVNKWIKLIDRLTKCNENKILIIGAPNQKEEIAQLIKKCKYRRRVYNLAGRTNVVQSIYLIAKSKVIIGGDSGPVHWAELTKTPIITLYGPTDEKRWGPPRTQGVALRKGSHLDDIKLEDILMEIKKFGKKVAVL